MDTAKPVTGSSCHLGKCLRKINTARQKGGKKASEYWDPNQKPSRVGFFHFPLSCIQGETHLNTMEEEDSGKEIDREGKSGELKKKSERGLSRGGEKKKRKRENGIKIGS